MRRTVVAQVLDYAAQVRSWDYERLQQLWRARHPGAGSLFQGVAPEDEEAAWIDTVSENLAAGRMTLLVVGDGIEGRAETLAEVVGGRPDFAFRLALVELRLYALEDGSVLVLPNILTRTREIERATVRIIFDKGPRPEVQVDVPQTTTGRARGSLSEESLLAELERNPNGGAAVGREILRRVEASKLKVEWKSASFVLKADDPMSEGDLLSLAVINKTGLVYVYPWIQGQIQSRWNDAELGTQLAKDLAMTVHAFGGETDSTGLQVSLQLTQLKGRERELVDALTSFMERVGMEKAKREDERTLS
jgi:hypothetical protein